MRQEGMIVTYTAPSAIGGRLIVTHASGTNRVELANAVTDPLIGVTTAIGRQDNGRCDVIKSGIAEVIAGGTITAGAKLTTDSAGKAVVIAAATDRVIGIAEAAAVTGDIFPVWIALG